MVLMGRCRPALWLTSGYLLRSMVVVVFVFIYLFSTGAVKLFFFLRASGMKTFLVPYEYVATSQSLTSP
jgi:hypothetical protein